jgi:transposase
MYSQFCHHYQQYTQKTKATMRILRKPGEQLEVDWAGQTASIIHRDSGEMIDVYVFVGVLSYSQYAYVEAFASQNQES